MRRGLGSKSGLLPNDLSRPKHRRHPHPCRRGQPPSRACATLEVSHHECCVSSDSEVCPRTSGRSHRSGCRTVARLETTARVLLAAPAGKSHGRSWLRRSRGPAIARAPSFGDGPVSPPCRPCLGPPAIRSNLVELPATRLDGPRTARQILNHPQGNGPERDRCVGARQVPGSLAL
jgi:hypothetical protein